jgi:hypothetical protein
MNIALLFLIPYRSSKIPWLLMLLALPMRVGCWLGSLPSWRFTHCNDVTSRISLSCTHTGGQCSLQDEQSDRGWAFRDVVERYSAALEAKGPGQYRSWTATATGNDDGAVGKIWGSSRLLTYFQSS